MNGTVTVRRSEQGFTLVELAIVMIIIGLLIGGILKGQELIQNARIASTVAQIKGYDAAATTFRDKFNAVPGDMLTPGTRLVNCTAAPCNIPGDGDTQIDSNFGAAPSQEAQNFWVHLASADLITGIDPALGAVWGGTYPAAKIDGGYDIDYAAINTDLAPGGQATAATFRAGHYIALHNAPGAAVGVPILTPNQSFRIDSKMDDGNPVSGSVIGGGNAACFAAGVYDEATDLQNCVVFIRIQQ